MNLAQRIYRGRVVQHFEGLLASAYVPPRVVNLLPAALALVLLDLEPARDVLAACYARRKGGRPPRDPLAMLRTLVLMSLVGETSFDRMVDRLRSEPELAVLAGFSPRDVPGVGTFYDFCARVFDGPHRRPCAHVERPSRRFSGNRGRFRRNLRAEKARVKDKAQAELVVEHEAPVQAAVNRASTNLKNPPRRDFQGRLNELLFRCGVVPSAEAGLLGDVTKMRVAADGSPIESGANCWGRATCTCRAEGRDNCECDRVYSDADATWGWDSHRKKYVFGYRLHGLIALAAGIELPLHLSVTGAHEPDVMAGVDAFVQLYKWMREYLPQARILYDICDAGYDATWFYKLVLGLGSVPIIPLAKLPATPQGKDGIARDPNGTPLCPGGAPMWRHSFDKKTDKIVYGCPAKRPGRKRGKAGIVHDVSRCPRGEFCEPDTRMGPIVRVAVDDDPRLNPPISRSSPLFAEIYNGRTAAERHFAHAKGPAKLARRPWRSQRRFAIGAFAHALGRHAMARVVHGCGLPRDLAHFLQLLGAAAEPEQRAVA